MKRIIMLFAFSILQGCTSAKSDPAVCESLPNETVKMTPAPSGIRYFPDEFGQPTRICKFGERAKCYPLISKIERDWYPEHWQAANEPSLFEAAKNSKDPGAYQIRFTWLRTFDNPVIVRFESDGKNLRLIGKELSGSGGYEPGVIERSVEKSLTPGQAKDLEAILAKTALFDQPASTCDLGVDGSEWIIERTDKTGYTLLKRWTPENGPMREFGMFALNLTGWKYEEVY